MDAIEFQKLLDDKWRHLVEEHRLLISRIKHPACRKIQYFLEELPRYWAPTSLSFWDGELLHIGYQRLSRVIPTEDEVRSVAQFLSSEQPPLRYSTAIVLRYSIPNERIVLPLLRDALKDEDELLVRHAMKSLEYLESADPNDGSWSALRTLQRSEIEEL